MRVLRQVVVFAVFSSCLGAGLARGNPADYQTALHQLTHHSEIDYYPTWSPDGETLVFSSGRDGVHLWRVPSDGGGEPVRVTEIEANHPRWSPEGSFIAFDSRQGTRLMLMSPQGSVPLRVMTGELELTRGAHPCWSPDGKILTFTAGGAVWVYEIETGEMRRLFSQEGWHARAFSWSPDGRFVTADMDRSPNKNDDDVYLLPVAGGPVRRLTDRAGREGNPVFSPDGSMIAYMWDADGAESLWVTTPEGERHVQITSYVGFNANPRWSPDGQRIAFSSDRGGSPDIWVMDLDVGALRKALGIE